MPFNISLDTYTDTFEAILSFPDANYVDALSGGQLKSKEWLIDELNDNLSILPPNPIIFIVGGWIGTLSAFLFDGYKGDIHSIRSIDIDPSSTVIADIINRVNVVDGWRFKAITADMFDVNYTKYTWQGWSHTNKKIVTVSDRPDIIINTSCEHLNCRKWLKKIPSGTTVVLQSNNYFEAEDHINCVNNVEEFVEMVNLSEVYYKGTYDLDIYNRFMIIGKK